MGRWCRCDLNRRSARIGIRDLAFRRITEFYHKITPVAVEGGGEGSDGISKFYAVQLLAVGAVGGHMLQLLFRLQVLGDYHDFSRFCKRLDCSVVHCFFSSSKSAAECR